MRIAVRDSERPRDVARVPRFHRRRIVAHDMSWVRICRRRIGCSLEPAAWDLAIELADSDAAAHRL